MGEELSEYERKVLLLADENDYSNFSKTRLAKLK